MTGWRDLSDADLEREYSPSSMVGGDAGPFLADYARRSAEARAALDCVEDQHYGPGAAQRLDLFPGPAPNGRLFVFVHGGYWQELSHKDSAPMAPQVVAAGQSFAAIDYTLAPRGTIEDMVAETAAALAWLAEATGATAMTVAGHSAGAHLVASQLAGEAGLPAVVDRLILISGVYDLRPLARTPINDALGLDEARAGALSPLLQAPRPGPAVRLVVGDFDTAQFIAQSHAYADHLRGHGIAASCAVVPGRNHFDIITDVSYAL